ncbi:MAG: hypothetical protein D6820_05860 [Lentisphaerae bacterium]|nr:MAG: hypothetical protein D6820_05860 [Lentisphaerota bacterium]
MKPIDTSQHHMHQVTLVELITAMAVLLILMSSLMAIFVSMNKIVVTQQDSADVYREQRLLFELISRDLQGMVVSDVSGEELACKFETPSGSGYRMRFVTTSGIGVDTAALGNLIEVGYYFDSPNHTLYRVSSARGDAQWDPIGNTTVNAYLPDAGTSGYNDSAVVSRTVYEFNVAAYKGTTLIATDTTTYPDLVILSASIFDPEMAGGTWTQAEIQRKMITFHKKIFIKRRLQ